MKDRRLLLLKCRKFEGPFSLANFTISPALYKEKSLLLTQLISGTGLDYSDHQDATLLLRPPGCALSPPSSSAAS